MKKIRSISQIVLSVVQLLTESMVFAQTDHVNLQEGVPFPGAAENIVTMPSGSSVNGFLLHKSLV